MKTKQQTKKLVVITLALALIFSMSATVYAISVSTTNVTLWTGGGNAAAYSNRKTVTVGGTAWVASMAPESVRKGVVLHQNRMQSFTLTAAGAKPGKYYAYVKKGGEKVVVTITVKAAPF